KPAVANAAANHRWRSNRTWIACGAGSPFPYSQLPRNRRSMRVIKTVNLTKKYGDMYAIRGITLELQQGDLFGFIGPNGAGKTTTMRIIATLLTPTYGEAYVC